MSRRRKSSAPPQNAPTRARSLLMARVRRSGTAPEVTLRSALHSVGYRYRINGGSGLPGTPDIVLRQLRLAIFVDGCFWHGCPCHGTVPKTNTDFWTAKILRNQSRDKQVDQSLKQLGWRVLRVWEHDVRDNVEKILRRVNRLSQTLPPSH
jgi:DNA mismatch endonuclease (patch repair protein)